MTALWAISTIAGCALDLTGTWAGGGGCEDDTSFEASFLLAYEEESEGIWAGDGEVIWERTDSLSSEYVATLTLEVADEIVTSATLSDCIAGYDIDYFSPTTDCGSLEDVELDEETKGRLSATWTNFMNEVDSCAMGLVLFR